MKMSSTATSPMAIVVSQGRPFTPAGYSKRPDLIHRNVIKAARKTVGPDDGHILGSSCAKANVQGGVVAGSQAGTTLHFLHLGMTIAVGHVHPRADSIPIHRTSTHQAHGQPMVSRPTKAFVVEELIASVPIAHDNIPPSPSLS